MYNNVCYLWGVFVGDECVTWEGYLLGLSVLPERGTCWGRVCYLRGVLVGVECVTWEGYLLGSRPPLLCLASCRHCSSSSFSVFFISSDSWPSHTCNHTTRYWLTDKQIDWLVFRKLVQFIECWIPRKLCEYDTHQSIPIYYKQNIVCLKIIKAIPPWHIFNNFPSPFKTVDYFVYKIGMSYRIKVNIRVLSIFQTY